MKKSFMLIAVALLAFAGSAYAFPPNTATGTGNASARIILPISVGQDEALSFGTFFSGATSGTVTVNSNGTSGSQGSSRTSGGGVTLYTGTQGTNWQQAEWSIEGEVGFLYTITGIAGAHTVTSGSNTMSYLFNAPTGNGPVGTIGTDTSLDTDDVMYGGVLTVGANQAAGTYTGTYTLTATYN